MSVELPDNLPPEPLRQPSRMTHVEPARWSLAWAGFYVSCAGVALGATFAGGGYFFFGSTGWLVFGGFLSGVSCVTCFFSLRAARRGLAK